MASPRLNSGRNPSSQSKTSKPPPLPPTNTWSAAPEPAVPPSQVHTLPFNTQRRIAEAHEILNSREKLVWVANARNESIAATELHFQEVIGLPSLLGTTGPRREEIYVDLKWRDRVSDELQERIWRDELGLGSEDEEEDKERVAELLARKRKQAMAENGREKVKKTAKGAAKSKEKRNQEEDQQMQDVGDDEEDDEGGVSIVSHRKRPR
ncbi:MAG: hypothetical protein Q9162_001376 [Coniocarpon cinnabarinum]